jgi:hypothetical protein
MGYVRKDHNVVGSKLNWSGGNAIVSKFPEAFTVETTTAK